LHKQHQLGLDQPGRSELTITVRREFCLRHTATGFATGRASTI
jgi:hypothetical protein